MTWNGIIPLYHSLVLYEWIPGKQCYSRTVPSRTHVYHVHTCTMYTRLSRTHVYVGRTRTLRCNPNALQCTALSSSIFADILPTTHHLRFSAISRPLPGPSPLPPRSLPAPSPLPAANRSLPSYDVRVPTTVRTDRGRGRRKACVANRRPIVCRCGWRQTTGRGRDMKLRWSSVQFGCIWRVQRGRGVEGTGCLGLARGYKLKWARACWPWRCACKEKVGLVVVGNERGGGVEIGNGGDVRGRQ